MTARRVAILTASFGMGHLAIAAKLRSHLAAHAGVSSCDTIDFLADSDLGAHVAELYQRMCAQPRSARDLNPFFQLERWVPGCAELIARAHVWLDGKRFSPFGRKRPGAVIGDLPRRLAGYDVVVCTAYAAQVIVERALRLNPRLVTVNVSQNLGADLRSVYAKTFWTAFLAAEPRSLRCARRRLGGRGVAVVDAGPVYDLGDYLEAARAPAEPRGGAPSAIVLVGRTGVGRAYLARLSRIARDLVEAGYRVVLRSDPSHGRRVVSRLGPIHRRGIVVEPFGPIGRLNDHRLVVAKGSYNQATEAIVWGVPFAASAFLAHWEDPTADLARQGAALLDFSRPYTVPAPRELEALGARQRRFREAFIRPPGAWARILSDILAAAG